METKEISFDEILKKYPSKERSNLIPMLQDIQELQGYISPESIKVVSEQLNLPSSKIYGVATFYNQFRLEEPGKHMIQVCRGTACHVKGSKQLLEAIERELGVRVSQTTRDKRFTLETVACLGACSIAPVLCIDGQFHGRVSIPDIPKILEQYE